MKTKFLTLAIISGSLAMSACSKADAAKPMQGLTNDTVTEHTIEATKVTHVNATQSSEWIQANPETLVLDIRTPREFNSGHIAGALNINFYDADFSTQLQSLDMSKNYVVHCASGGRSGKSLSTFKKLGFKHIVHMDGGIKAWNRAHLPTVK